MKRIQEVLSIATIALCVVSCQQDPFDGIVSHERAITSFSIKDGQVGVAEIVRTPEDGNVVVYYKAGTDLSAVVPQISTSYKSEVTPASGDVVNFSGSGHTFTYQVKSASGEVREWVVELKEYQFILGGSWKVSNLNFWYWIGEGESWGWQEPDRPLKSNISDAATEEDNVLTFELVGVNEEGKPHGTYTFTTGNDEASSAFIYNDGTDYKYKFRKIPIGTGTFVLNTNTVTLNKGEANEVETLPFVLSEEGSTLKLPFSPGPYNIDWGGDGNKQQLGAAKQFWYILHKE